MLFTQLIRRFLATTSLAIFLSLSMTFGFDRSLASTVVSQPLYLSESHLVAVNGIDAATKSIDETVQEALDNVAGDPQNKMREKPNQVKGKTQTKTEDLKDNLKLTGKANVAANKAEKKMQKANKKIAAKARKDFKNVSQKINAVIK